MACKGPNDPILGEINKIIREPSIPHRIFCFLAGVGTSSCGRNCGKSTLWLSLGADAAGISSKTALFMDASVSVLLPEANYPQLRPQDGGERGGLCHIGEESGLQGSFSAIAAGGGKMPKIMCTFVPSIPAEPHYGERTGH